MPVEEGELLLSVGGVVGRVDVDRDAAGAALESGAMVLDDQIGQSHTGQVQRGPIDGVLEAGESRLRGQRWPGQRVALEQELVDWVLSEPGRVVAVGVAAGDPVDALPHQLDELARTLPACRRSVRLAVSR